MFKLLRERLERERVKREVQARVDGFLGDYNPDNEPASTLFTRLRRASQRLSEGGPK